MHPVITSLPPKEVIAHFNKQYLVDYLLTQGFAFKEKQLEYHRKTTDFKQVIWHRCSKNNMTGHIIDFEVGYYMLAPKFKSWYKKKYGKDPVGGDSVIGYKRLNTPWNTKYGTPGNFGYDLVNKDIADQFAVILENIQQVMIPAMDFYTGFDVVIDHPNDKIPSGEIDFFARFRQIEHCLFKGYTDKAETLRQQLLADKTIPENYWEYGNKELARIFPGQ